MSEANKPMTDAECEEALRNPALLRTAEGDEYTDDTAAKWAWFAHGYDTGMEPFYSIDQMKAVLRRAQSSRNDCGTCLYKQHPDGGHCYMFRTEPEGICEKHTQRANAAIAAATGASQ